MNSIIERNEIKAEFAGLIQQLNVSENEYQRIQKQYLDMQDIVWRLRNIDFPIYIQKGQGDIPQIGKKPNTKKSKQEEREKLVSEKPSISLGKIGCNKAVKSKISKYRTLMANIEHFKGDNKEKLRFSEGLDKDNDQELNFCMENRAVQKFVGTFKF